MLRHGRLTMDHVIRTTRSVCPVCLKNLPAQLLQNTGGQIFIKRECPEHGVFSAPVWRGNIDFAQWTQYNEPLSGNAGSHCPENCGICSEHEVGTCCTLLEVTKRCNLQCKFCFANGGTPDEDPSAEELKAAIRDIVHQCGQPLLQFSGGEPTLRDDLPDLVRYAKEAGCSYVQVNTNGIRLAHEPKYVQQLKDAGLDIVFLQFDGTRNDIYETLRGTPLLETKIQAIHNCADLRIGVTLVPTVVRGVNTDNLGELIAFAQSMVPSVRGIHFQPVSYFGRYPNLPQADQRYTLDELMVDISDQAGIPIDSFMPSRCDHPLCGFHANFLVNTTGGLRPLSSITHSSKSQGCAKDNREYVARHWMRYPQEPEPVGKISDEMDFDTFLYRVRHNSLTLSAMAFQDAMNLNIERIHRCSLHVYNNGKIKPFCANYLTSIIQFQPPSE